MNTEQTTNIERIEKISNTVAQLVGSAAVRGRDLDELRQHWAVIEPGIRALQAERDALYGALSRLLGELPTRRDWLDPVTEAMARDAIDAARATESGEVKP